MRYALALSCALLLSGCIMGDFGSSDRYQSDFHYTFDLKPGGELSLETMNGSVEIVGSDDPQVDVAGTKYGSTEQLRDDTRVDIQNSPEAIRIRTTRPSSTFGSSGARYTVRVPKTARVQSISTSNGGIRIRDVASAVELRSSNGSIRVEHVGSDVEARTSNNSIEVDEVAGNLNLKTSNGRIRAEGVRGTCEAETSNNSIVAHVDGSPAGPIRLASSNGSVELTLTEPPKSGVHMETRNGGLTIHLPASSSVHVDADTSNSGISSDFDVMTTAGVEPRKNHVDGNIGTGGPTLDLKTSNGHIRIVKGSGE